MKFEVNTKVESKGQRLDKFLKEYLSDYCPEISRSRIKTLIEDSQVVNLSNQNPITDCAYKIKGDEELLVTIPKPKPVSQMKTSPVVNMLSLFFIITDY